MTKERFEEINAQLEARDYEYTEEGEFCFDGLLYPIDVILPTERGWVSLEDGTFIAYDEAYQGADEEHFEIYEMFTDSNRNAYYGDDIHFAGNFEALMKYIK
jgi:hypothetical protein